MGRANSGATLSGSEERFSDVGALTFVVDQMPVGVFLVDGGGSVVWMNRSAQALMGKPGRVALRDGRLRSAWKAVNESLDRLVERAVAPASNPEACEPVAVILSRPSDASLLVAVIRPLEPLRGPDTQHAARAVIFVSDPGRHLRPSRERLHSLFGLSHAECGLVELLAAGHSLRAAAARLAITNESARTYLKRIFEKTGTRRQAELVALALAAAPAGASEP
jgi:DNA-binding CsgD family transcriptional regulator